MCRAEERFQLKIAIMMIAFGYQSMLRRGILEEQDEKSDLCRSRLA
jgi:hypothetical protein